MKRSAISNHTRYSEVACNWCDRRGRFALRRLYEQYGDIRVWDIVLEKARDCARRVEGQKVTELCGAYCPTLSLAQPRPRAAERGDELS